jgi:hypothetical protein
VAQAVRSLGYAPTEDDIAAFERTIRHRYDGMLTEQEFQNVMTGIVIPRLSKVKDPGADMNQAFKVCSAFAWHTLFCVDSQASLWLNGTVCGRGMRIADILGRFSVRR